MHQMLFFIFSLVLLSFHTTEKPLENIRSKVYVDSVLESKTTLSTNAILDKNAHFPLKWVEDCTLVPQVTAFAIQPSCTNGVAQSDGYLQLSSVTDGDRYHWSTGSTFDDNSGANTYANATDLTGATYPLQFNASLSNADVGDFTIRVYNGEDGCFTDVVVTLNMQDCMTGCDCTEMIYLNEPTTDGAVHKFSVATDGTLTEIGSPWFDNAVAMEGVTSPHGVAVDLNGFVYIGESNASGEIRKFTCDGEIFPESEFAISNGGQTNIATIDNILYTNKSGASFSFDFINAYDICTGDLIGTMEYCEDASSDWGFFIDPRTNEMYATTDAATVGTSRLYYFSQSDFDLDPTTCVSEVTVGEPLPQGAWGVFGVTTDIDRNVYIVIKHTGDDRTYIRKYGPAPNFQFIGQSAVDSGQDGAVYPNGGYGYGDAIGIIYSETANRIYVSTTSPIEDCVALFDTDLNYLGSAVPPVAGSDNAKGIAIVKDCCPTNNNMIVDTTLCAASVNDILFLQELISCDGVICEGLWQEGMSNTGLTYDPCDNSITIDALNACGTFTLESDGIGNNPQCGAFKIEVNIKVENITEPVITAGVVPTCANDNDPGAITISTPSTGSSTVSYRWQSSTTSCTDGFTDIAGAPTDGTDYDPNSLSVETYYRLIAEVNNTTCLDGACADTSNCIILTPESGCVPVCANPTVVAFAIQPSCTDGIAGNDGYLQLSSVTDGDRYHWSTGSTFDDNGGADTYANATDLTAATYPLQFNASLSNADVGDFTIRVYNGEDGCFTDVVVTLNMQDCMTGCDCTEMIYLNEPTTDGAVHKFSVATDGTLTEIGSPWFDNAVAMEGVTSPHGVAVDLNGFVYIGESNASGEIRKFTCDGEIFPESEFAISNGGQTNIATIDNILYTNKSGASFSFDFINAYDICTGDLIGTMEYCEDASSDWGFFIDPRTNEMYATTDAATVGTSRLYYFSQSDFDLDPTTCVSEVTVGEPLPQGAWGVFGVTTDIDRNVYVIIKHTGDDRTYIRKYGPAPNFQFIGQSAVDSGQDGAVYPNGGYGYGDAIGIIYSETANRIYVSTTSPIEDCVALFDTDLNYLGSAVPPVAGSDNAKGIAIVKDCCPTNNNMIVDTTLCAASVNDILFLQELISCDGVICEGLWQEGMSNTGLTYDPCDNSITIDALNACGTFTLESDGIGNNPQCGAFKIEVNIKVENITEPVITAGVVPTCANDNDPGAITISTPSTGSSTVSYRWQSSTTSCTDGFTDIAGAPTDGTDYDPNSLSVETYYRLIAEVNNTTCLDGACADTSNCIILTPESGCIPVCANPTVTAYAIQPSCTDGIAGNDGYLQLSSVTDGDRYHWSTGSTFDDNGGADTYANATDLTGATYPLQFNAVLGNADVGDFTIRVYNGEDGCFTDVVVTLNMQDCTTGCDCTEMIYLNEPTTDGAVHKFSVATDGTLTEIGSPWFDNAVAMEGVTSPHGVAVDLNGFVYIGESNASGEIRKFTCDGEIFPESEFAISNGGQTNIATIDNILYTNKSGASFSFDFINAYDICTGDLIGTMEYCEDASSDWGFFIDPRTNEMYATTDAATVGTSRLYYFSQSDFDLDPTTCVSEVTVGEPLPQGAWGVFGVTTDIDRNVYVIIKHTGDDRTYIRKYGPAPNFQFIGQSAVDSGQDGAVYPNGGYGYGDAIGIIYSETANRIYVSTTSPIEDCVALFDTDLNYLGSAVPPVAGSDNAKGIAIVKDCCPTNNNMIVDTTLCAASVNDILFLQELISCDGVICEGLWQEGMSNTGLTYDPCDNSITIDALNACGTFTLESDGIGNNPQCGAFKIEVNIKVENITEPVITAGVVPTCANDNDPGAITISTPSTGSSTVSYRWQSSTTSCTDGFTDIAGAPTDGTDYDPNSLSVETYYRLIAEVNNTTCLDGACADTSNCIILTPESGCVPVCANPTVVAFAIQPSCVDGVAGNDGYLQLSSITGGDRYHWSTSNTFDDNSGANTYANATDLTGATYPVQFNTGLSNTDVGTFTIRVYSSTADCFTDVVVTLNTQDCAQGCDCQEYLYSNDTDNDLVHKFLINPIDSTLIEVGNPWFEPINKPHGGVMDLNGVLYFAEKNDAATSSLFKIDCDGNFIDTLFYGDFDGTQFNNFVMEGNILYVNGAGGDDVKAYDICEERFIGTIDYCCGNFNWELFEGADGNMYTTDKVNDSLYIYQVPYDTSLYNGTVVLQPVFKLFDAAMADRNDWGVETDLSGNWYVVLHNNSFDTRVLKFDASGTKTGEIIDSVSDGVGFFDGRGVVWSEATDLLYVASGNDDCVAVIAASSMTYLAGLSIPGGGGKDLSLVKECCPTNNTVTIDTTLCAASLDDVIFLQDLIGCDGGICEGVWQEGGSNTGLTYDPCDNSVTITASDACGAFTLESDGIGNNPQCGAFKIEVNIKVENVSTPVITAGTAPACANNNDPGAITISTPSTGSSTVSYRWQSSTTSCTDGFTDIAGAPTDGTDYDPNSLSVETYYRLIAEVNNTTCLDGACADTSNCIILTPESGCVPVCANPTVVAFAIQPSCVDGVAGNDGYLQLSSITGGDRYHWSTSNTFDDNGGANTYANATDLTGATYPLQFNTGLSNADVGDFTIRVYNGADDCFTDVVVTLNTQDCVVGCECKEIIYLNEPTTGGAVHKYEIDMTDGGLTELAGVNGIPWFDNAAQGESITSPHGAGTDINGNIYIGEEAASGRIRKLDCNGNIKPVSEFSAGIGGQFNIGSIGNLIYANNNTTAGNQITAYDACSGELDSWVRLTGIQSSGDNRDWGFYIDPRTKTMYSTSTWTPNGTFNGFYVFNQSDFGTPGNYINRITPSPALPNDVAIRGITTDAAGNIYVVVKGNSACGKCSYLLKYDSSFNLLATGPTDLIDGDGGWHNSIGIVYSETADLLYVSSESTTDDCLYIFDTDLVPVRGEIPSPGTGDNGKGITILQECCPTNNNQVVDTTLCATSIGDVLFLAELINCNGSICEGMWQEGLSNSGLTYNSCNNSVTIDALDACGSFTLESDGTGNAPQCGAFKITVNISVLENPSVTLIPDSTICPGGTITLYGVLDQAGTPTYQWQQSTTSCITGFSNIGGATDSTYAATPTDTTYYRLITTSTDNCTSGTCADTSACTTVYPTKIITATVADVLKCTSSSETITVVPDNGVGPYTYSWSGPFITNPGNVDSFTASSPGIYTVTVTDSEGCTSISSGEMTFQSKVCLPATFSIKRGARN